MRYAASKVPYRVAGCILKRPKNDAPGPPRALFNGYRALVGALCLYLFGRLPPPLPVPLAEVRAADKPGSMSIIRHCPNLPPPLTLLLNLSVFLQTVSRFSLSILYYPSTCFYSKVRVG